MAYMESFSYIHICLFMVSHAFPQFILWCVMGFGALCFVRWIIFCSLGLECFALFGIATPFSWLVAPPAAVVESWRTLQTSCRIGGSNNTDDVLLLFFFSNLFDYFQRRVPCPLGISGLLPLEPCYVLVIYSEHFFVCIDLDHMMDGLKKDSMEWGLLTVHNAWLGLY